MKRRDFFTSSTLLGASIPLGVTPLISSCSSNGHKSKNKESFTPEQLGMPSFAEQAPDGRPLKAGLIGCGSRGTGAAVQFLNAGNDLSIVALADVFEDRQQKCREILIEEKNNEVDDDKCFLGFDAYKKVLEQDIDLVLIASPTHFHPDQFKAAVEAGKHVFMEKPAGVDPVGIRTVLVAAKQAEAMGLTVVTGNQRRNQRDYWEAYMQIKNGAIGDVLSATAHWNQGAWWNKLHRPEWTDMEYNIRNWFNIKWLSGDHLLDQGVHNIDVVTWFTGWLPETAVGYGGRARRMTGDIFDFFSVDYRYANNKRMMATARQIDGCDQNVSESVMGTEGVLYTAGKNTRIENFDGEVIWKYDYDANPVVGGHQQEHVHLVESIRLNKKVNQAEDIALSTLVSIMGREATYTGKEITWDEIMASDLRYGPTEYALGPLPDYKEGVAPVPGRDPKAPL
jgi:myo-inositol 2-dehydrogenase/D-chiro-inositol 1-dehydrogenase